MKHPDTGPNFHISHLALTCFGLPINKRQTPILSRIACFDADVGVGVSLEAHSRFGLDDLEGLKHEVSAERGKFRRFFSGASTLSYCAFLYQYRGFSCLVIGSLCLLNEGLVESHWCISNIFAEYIKVHLNYSWPGF